MAEEKSSTGWSVIVDYTPSPTERKDTFKSGGVIINLDTNAYKPGVQTSPMVVIPDYATETQRHYAEQYAKRIADVYAKKFGSSKSPKVLTRSQNKRGRPATIHTEPYALTDKRAADWFDSEEGHQVHAQILRETLGKIPGAKFSIPHNPSRGDSGAAYGGRSEVDVARRLVPYLEHEHLQPVEFTNHHQSHTGERVDQNRTQIAPMEVPPPDKKPSEIPPAVPDGVLIGEPAEKVAGSFGPPEAPQEEPDAYQGVDFGSFNTQKNDGSVLASVDPDLSTTYSYDGEPSSFQPYKGTSVEEALENHRKAFYPDDEYPSWGQTFNAIGQSNFTINSVEYYYNQLNPLYTTNDPEFTVPAQELAEYPEYMRDWLAESPNEAAWKFNKAEADSRLEGLETFRKMGWGQYIVAGGGDLAIDFIPAIALAVPTEGASVEAFLATRLTTLARSSRVFQAARLGTASAAAAGVESVAHMQSGQMDEYGALWYAATAGVLGGAVGSAFPKWSSNFAGVAKNVDEAILESAEDAALAAAKIKGDEPRPGVEVPEPVAAVRPNDDLQIKPKRKLMDKEVVVTRENDSVKTRAAVANVDDDVLSMSTAVKNKEKPFLNATESKPFFRQSHANPARTQVYVAIPDGTDATFLTKAGKAGSVVAYKTRQAAQDTGSRNIVKINVPKGARVVDLGAFSDDVEVNTAMLIGDGEIRVKPDKVKRKRDASGDEYVSNSADLKPNTVIKGEPQVVRAVYAESGERVEPGALAEYNDTVTGLGFDAVNAPGSSAGAMRVSAPTRNAIANRDALIRAYVDDPDRGLERDGLIDTGWSIARLAIFARSANSVIRNNAYPLLGGALDKTGRNLADEGTQGPSVLEVKRMLQNRYDTKIAEANTKFLRAFVEETGARGTPLQRHVQFNEMVTAYRRSQGRMNVPEAVKAYSAELDKVADDFRKLMQDPGRAVGQPGAYEPLKGSEDLVDSKFYTPRNYSYSKIQQLQREFNDNVIEEALFQNFKYTLAHTSLTDAQLRVAARGMYQTIMSAKGHWDNVMDASFGNATLEDLTRMVERSGIDMQSADAQALLKFFEGELKTGSTAGPNLKSRVFLTEDYQMTFRGPNGKLVKGTLAMFTETDATALFRNYAARNSGRIALGTFVVRGADGKPTTRVVKNVAEDGTVLEEAIRPNTITSDADWQKFRSLVQGFANAKALDKPKVDAFGDDAILDNFYQYATHSYPNNPPEALRFAKMITNGVYLMKAGFAQLGEMGHGIATLGTSYVFRLPAFRQFMSNMRTAFTKGDDEFVIPLTKMAKEFGIGGEMGRLPGSDRLDYAADAYANVSSRGMGARMWLEAQDRAERFQAFTLKYSGLLPLQSWQQTRFYEAWHDKMLSWAEKYTPSTLPRGIRNRLREMGLNNADIDEAIRMYRDPNIIVRNEGGILKQVYDAKIPPNKEAVWHRINLAYIRNVTRAVQEDNWGAMFPGSDHWVTKQFTHLRSFMIGSYTQQLVNNTRKAASLLKQAGGDIKAGNMSAQDGLLDTGRELAIVGNKVMAQMMTAIIFYVALKESEMLGLSEWEREEKREQLYDPANLASAAVSRSGIFSAVPFAYDNTMGYWTGSTWSGYRSTGLSEGLFGNPTLGYIDQGYKALGGAYDLAVGEGDAGDLQKIRGMFTNMITMQVALDYAARNMFDLDEPDTVTPEVPLQTLRDYVYDQ